MASFSFEHCPSSLLDSALLPPNPAIKISGLIEDGEMINASFFSFPDISDSQTPNASSSFQNGSAAALEQLTPDVCSSFAAEDAIHLVKADRKRKKRDGSSLNSPLSKVKPPTLLKFDVGLGVWGKSFEFFAAFSPYLASNLAEFGSGCAFELLNFDPSGGKGRKQKDGKKETEEKRKPKAEKPSQKEVNDLPPTGYIHVRARRGQATDSHSLAERVRREKISERMNLLQGLVPGCDKFLSMKLAFHGFRVDFYEDCMAKSQIPNSASHFQGVQRPNPSQFNALRDTYHTTFPARNNYPSMNSPDPHLLHGRSPESFSE
ncbi:hypothetical protein ACLOJK_002195, partial [Asimina triloba]